MINWAADEYCRRCQQLLQPPQSPAGSGFSTQTIYLYLFIFIAAVAIPLVLGMGNSDSGDDIGLYFVMAAFGVTIACKFMLLFDMFRVSLLWGAAGLFLSPVSTLIFIATHWNRARGKVYTTLLAFFYCFLMIFISAQVNKPKMVQNTAQPPAAPATRAPASPAAETRLLEPAKVETKKKTTGN